MSNKAIFNLWLMLVVLITLDVYMVTYDILLMAFPKTSHCKVPTLSDSGNDWFYSFTRSMNYAWWPIPVLYIFWPEGCCKKT